MAVKSYRELEVWQKSMDHVVACYEAISNFPNHELYGLSAQLRRAVISVPSNIAEGQGRSSTKDFLRHLAIAYGSLMESQTQLEIAERLGYINSQAHGSLMEQSNTIARMLNGLTNALNRKL